MALLLKISVMKPLGTLILSKCILYIYFHQTFTTFYKRNRRTLLEVGKSLNLYAIRYSVYFDQLFGFAFWNWWSSLWTSFQLDLCQLKLHHFNTFYLILINLRKFHSVIDFSPYVSVSDVSWLGDRALRNRIEKQTILNLCILFLLVCMFLVGFSLFNENLKYPWVNWCSCRRYHISL